MPNTCQQRITNIISSSTCLKIRYLPDDCNACKQSDFRFRNLQFCNNHCFLFSFISIGILLKIIFFTSNIYLGNVPNKFVSISFCLLTNLDIVQVVQKLSKMISCSNDTNNEIEYHYHALVVTQKQLLQVRGTFDSSFMPSLLRKTLETW